MKDFKRIDLDDPSTFGNISVNDRLIVDNFGKGINALVIRKDKNNFYGAYRTKTITGQKMINVNTYHYFQGDNIENFGADYNFVENDPITGKFYAEYDELMKKAEM